VHCTAGKDRTGFASAVVLLALGVSEQTVFEDYLRTNYYQQDFFRFILRWVPLYSFFRTDPEDMLPLIEARREYLQVALDEMVARYGSVDAYLEQALGVDADRLDPATNSARLECVPPCGAPPRKRHRRIR
jgi:protein-tyrosine phosphatase